MSLGVLNNLSAMYAENNLNNTSNSLNTVLQQLSSGSKINSGADDAAGLSLVDGLQANSMALAQSQTNASEGVGLLKVADGALSQVTNLLNRAVTLATEASNGTLNTSQDAAANSEYQSILSEINNIGATTTYNNQTVFGAAKPVSIYTGDSSSAGASVDALNISSLSSSNVGDTGGVMAYSNGSSNVFLNLSTSTANAGVNDTLNTGGSTSLNVKYLVEGTNGDSTTSSATITTGGSSLFQNTVGGMINAINNSGLGLTATFATQTQAGVQGGGAQTGIEITGGLVSAGVDPSASSTSGVLNPSGITAGELLTQDQTISVSQGGTVAGTVTINSSINTLQEVANAINTGTGAGVTGFGSGQVLASVVTNGDGTQSLSLANSSSTQGALTVSTGTGGTPAPVFAAGLAGSSTVAINGAGGALDVTGTAYQAGVASTVTINDGGGNLTGDVLSAGGSITLTNSATNAALTFVVGSGTNTSTTFYTGNNTVVADRGNTLGDLTEAIHEQKTALGGDATLTSGTGIVVTAATAQTGTNITASANLLTNADATVGLYNPTDGGAAVVGSVTVTALDAGATTATTDSLNVGGTITLSDGNPVDNFTFTATSGQKVSDLLTALGTNNLGVTAAFDAANHTITLTSTAKGANPITVTGLNTLVDTTQTGSPAMAIDTANTDTVVGVAAAPATMGTAILQLSQANGPANITDGSADFTGQIELKNGAGATYTFIMGAGTTAGTTVYTGANTVNSLVDAINGTAALDMTATVPGGGTGGIFLQGTVAGTTITNPGGAANTLANATNASLTNVHNGFTVVNGNNAVDVVAPASGTVNTSDTMTGSIKITNGTTSDIFIVGSGSNSAVAGTFYTDNTDNGGTNYGSTLANLAQLVTAQSATLGLNAQATTNGLTLTQTGVATTYTGDAISTGANSLFDTTQGVASTATVGETSVSNLNGAFASESDTLSGALKYTVGSSNTVQSIAMSTVTGAGYLGTVSGLISYINANSTSGANLGMTATWSPDGSNGFGSITLQSNTPGSTGTITPSALTSLTDTTTTANLSYTQTSAYNTGISSGTNTVYDHTTGQSSSVSQAATFASDSKASSGIATISYTDGAGQSLSSTDLSNSADAKASLTALNAAITDVAAQDGYIGAQINTLNSVSSVLATQQQNVVAAQNAVQATDYASAASNMSKYEILSQTGISALAQANSMQQEVTKLLQ